MSIKLVAVDIDGTLITNDRKITTEVFHAVQEAKEQGVKVVIATGRPIAGVQNLLEELNLRDAGDYVITFNGGLVQDTATGQEIVKETMTYDDYRDIEYLSRKLNVHMHAITKEGIFTANRNIGKYTVHESTLVNMPIFYRTPEEMTGKEIVKMMMIDEPEILDKAISRIPAEVKEKYTVLKSAPYFLEILDKRVNKGTGVKSLADALGIKAEEVMAIGDQENDIAMIEYAGVGVAMDNAIPSVKEIANFVTKSNLEDGVAYAIEKFALN